MAMTTPETKVGRFAVENVTEWSVSIVAGATEHCEIAVKFAREKDSVTVEWQECVFKLMECLEIICPGDTDSGPVISVTPSYIIAVFDKANAWVVTIYPFTDFFIIAFEFQRFGVYFPIHSVFAESYV